MSAHRAFPKAVIFTHFGSLVYEKKVQEKVIPYRHLKDGYIKRYTEVLHSYMKCNRKKKLISRVYIYVDWAVRKSLPLEITSDYDGKPTFKFNVQRRVEEQRLIAVLKQAKDIAQTRLSSGRNRIPYDDFPEFYCIGMDNLLDLLRNLIQAGEPRLTSFLCGKGQQFTYDSPKFVEAVIRLARGRIPHLATDPIIRFDEDVEPNPRSIEILLQEYRDIEENHPFYFFSGTYGDPDGRDDPINDHAVRTHWFFPIGTKSLGLRLREEMLRELMRTEDMNTLVRQMSDSPRLLRGQAVQKNLELLKATKQAYHFLADLSYLGATEVNNSSSFYSKAVRQLSARKGGTARSERQVISGAGLIMSNLAVDLLPPFMNFTNQTVWVDDHIKRLLHEALQDIAEKDRERVGAARLRQERHRDGIEPSDIGFARNAYFERLLRGCLLHRVIVNLEGDPTEYSKLIGDIVAYRMKKNDRKLSQPGLGSLKKRLQRQLEKHCALVLRCWSSREFDNSESFNWAKRLLAYPSLNLKEEKEVESYEWIKKRSKERPIRGSQVRTEVVRQWLCESVVQDAMDYIDLVRNWPIFTRAIARLEFSETWLFSQDSGNQ